MIYGFLMAAPLAFASVMARWSGPLSANDLFFYAAVFLVSGIVTDRWMRPRGSR